MQPPVILVIPAWDEAESIGALLSQVPPELVGEVVVVVGSSADPTAAVAAAHGARIIAQSRSGYGAACWEGAREAAALGAEVVVFLDGDYADPPMELRRCSARCWRMRPTWCSAVAMSRLTRMPSR